MCIILYEYSTKFGNTHCNGSVSPRDWTKQFLESLALSGGTEQLPQQAFCARWLESCIFEWLGLHIFSQKIWQCLNIVRTEKPADGTYAWQKQAVKHFGNFEYSNAVLELRAWTCPGQTITSQINKRNDIGSKWGLGSVSTSFLPKDNFE